MSPRTTTSRSISPDGPVDIDHVTVGPAHPWTVWELTVADNHNFTVLADDTPVLVHNCGVSASRIGHILDGDENGGFHHAPGGNTPDGRRIVSRSEPTGTGKWAGAYEAMVEICTPGCRTKPSTMFPDSWSRSRVTQTIQDAYAHAVSRGLPEGGGRVTGVSPTGHAVVLVVNASGELLTAYPSLQ